jgi:hypothetical protein
VTRFTPLIATVLALCGCSAPHDIHLSDERSASHGPLFFFGWADPALIPGTRLVDAPPGSRLVLWNEAGLEAIVDLGDACPVLVLEGDGARAPTGLELSVIGAVFPEWPVVASSQPQDYRMERRLERRFPSHIRDHVEGLRPPALVEFATGDAPAGWMALGGRVHALSLAAHNSPPQDLPRILGRASMLEGEERLAVFGALLARDELAPAELLKIVAAGASALAVAHPAANEEVCLAAIDSVAKEPLSSARRRGLERILESPGVTPQVLQRVLEVPLAFPEDREAIRVKVMQR